MRESCCDGFDLHFVRTGRIDKDTAKVFHDLFERRQEGDYVDFVQFRESQIDAWLSEAEAFVQHVAHLLTER